MRLKDSPQATRPLFQSGQAVTLLGPPAPSDPYITHFQYRGVIGEVIRTSGGFSYSLLLEDFKPHDVGVFPERRLAAGWQVNARR